jgi:hypothetical protein
MKSIRQEYTELVTDALSHSKQRNSARALVTPEEHKALHKLAENKPVITSKPKPQDDAKIRQFLESASIQCSDRIPDDAGATKHMLSYKEYLGELDVVLLACDTDADTLTLIKNLSKSIEKKLGTIKILRPDRLENENKWLLFTEQNPLKLLIASAGFVHLKHAMSHYKPPEGTMHGFLNQIPLVLLLPHSSYSPQEKSLLWKLLCSLL